MKLRLIFLLTIMLFSLSTAHGAEQKETHFPSLISSLRLSTPLTFCGEKVPIEIQNIRERLEKELLLTLWDRPQVILWLKRSSRYLPIIEKMLEENKIPEDLKYVTKGGNHILIPKGSAKGFHRRYQNLLKDWVASKKEFVYIVKQGDNLSFIAERFNVPLAALIIWNKLDLKAHIHPGDRLIIYSKEVKNENAD